MKREQKKEPEGNAALSKLRSFFPPLLIAHCSLLILFSCSSSKSLENAPIITSASRQHTLYNGKEQPIEAKAAKENAPVEVTYFLSEEDLIADRNGTTQAPTEVGYYYARIRRPAGNGYRAGRDITVEYHIQKALEN
jgi:hypothetical protein